MARPSVAIRSRSTVRSSVVSELVNVLSSAGAGRVFFFGGGISPAVTRSSTLTQRANNARLFKSNGNAVRSSPPFFVSASWHWKQFFFTNVWSSFVPARPMRRLTSTNTIVQNQYALCWLILRLRIMNTVERRNSRKDYSELLAHYAI